MPYCRNKHIPGLLSEEEVILVGEIEFPCGAADIYINGGVDRGGGVLRDGLLTVVSRGKDTCPHGRLQGVI